MVARGGQQRNGPTEKTKTKKAPRVVRSQAPSIASSSYGQDSELSINRFSTTAPGRVNVDLTPLVGSGFQHL